MTNLTCTRCDRVDVIPVPAPDRTYDSDEAGPAHRPVGFTACPWCATSAWIFTVRQPFPEAVATAHATAATMRTRVKAVSCAFGGWDLLRAAEQPRGPGTPFLRQSEASQPNYTDGIRP